MSFFTSIDVPGLWSSDSIQLTTDKLLTVLERGLVSIVNDVGVDINKAVMDPYYRHHLPFIAGLGPRKAQAMLKKIAQLVNPYLLFVGRRLTKFLSYLIYRVAQSLTESSSLRRGS